jgi:hypothetical protein
MLLEIFVKHDILTENLLNRHEFKISIQFVHSRWTHIAADWKSGTALRRIASSGATRGIKAIPQHQLSSFSGEIGNGLANKTK